MIPDWKIERYRLGEASQADKALIDAALLTDATLKTRLEQLAADDAAIIKTLPAERVAARVTASSAAVGESARSKAMFFSMAFPMVAAAAVAVIAVTGAFSNHHSGKLPEVLLKGDGPSLRIFRLAGDQPERLTDGAQVKAHDVIQVAFDAAGMSNLVIVSVDGAHHTTLHWPIDGNSELPQGLKAVPQAFELDDAPGFERFFLVTSATAISPNEVLKAAESVSRTGELALPAALTQRSLLLEKGSP